MINRDIKFGATSHSTEFTKESHKLITQCLPDSKRGPSSQNIQDRGAINLE